jgi:hypothetical protein
MHANGGHDRLDGLRLNACIAWKSCQRKIWTGLSSTGPWPSATCTGHAGSSFLGHVNTYHHTSPCALSWCSACMSKTLVHVATHKLGCCWLIDRSEVCQLCAGDRMQRLRLCVFQRTSVCSMDLLGQPCNLVLTPVSDISRYPLRHLPKGPRPCPHIRARVHLPAATDLQLLLHGYSLLQANNVARIMQCLTPRNVTECNEICQGERRRRRSGRVIEL